MKWWDWISARNVFRNSSQSHCPRDVKGTTTPGGVFLSMDWTGLAVMLMFSRFQTVSSTSLRSRSFVVQFLTCRCWCAADKCQSSRGGWRMVMRGTHSLRCYSSSLLFISFALRFIFPRKMQCYLFIYLLFIANGRAFAPDCNVFGKRRVRVQRSTEKNATDLLKGRRWQSQQSDQDVPWGKLQQQKEAKRNTWRTGY